MRIFPMVKSYALFIFANVRKNHGKGYKPATFTAFQRSIHRPLNAKGSTENFLKEDEFKLSQVVLHFAVLHRTIFISPFPRLTLGT